MFKSITSAKVLKSGYIYALPRGGYVVKTSKGLLQTGSPPETIKDSILYIDDVPKIFCVGEIFFSPNKGINIAELEFPIYYNFFIKKRKTIIIASKKSCMILEKIIKLILFGETAIRVDRDYNPKSKLPIPDIKKEISFFLNYSFDDIVEFIHLDKNNQCVLGIQGEVQIKYKNNEFIVIDKGFDPKITVRVPMLKYSGFYQNHYYPSSEVVFNPPHFGMTCLGASHGFDPDDNTSGFIFWINGSGILIDPPINTTDILNKVGINPKLLSSMILTHIHADHDSGFFQKIIEESRIKVYTTQTIMDMWLRKYSLITSLPVAKIKHLFDFIPVLIDKPINILGMEFIFRYMIHSIPTIGFTMKMRNKKITFSSDHLNEPVFFKELLDNKYINKARYHELMNFPWDSDIIYHEAGIPPLHTPVTFLDSLPEKIKKKISLYHISKSSVPQKSNLKRCEPGTQHSLTYKVRKTKKDANDRLVDILSQNVLVKKYGITYERCQRIFKSETHKIIKLSIGKILSLNSLKDNIYLIISGALGLRNQRNKVYKKSNSIYKKVMPAYQLITGDNIEDNIQLRSLATTEVVVIDKKHFLNQTKNGLFDKRLKKRVGLDIKVWDTLISSELFKVLTFNQRADLVSLMTPILIKKGDKYCCASKPGLYFFHSGKVTQNHKQMKIKKGDIWGSLGSSKILLGMKKVLLNKATTKEIPLIEIDYGLVYYLDGQTGDFFLNENPGLIYRFY